MKKQTRLSSSSLRRAFLILLLGCAFARGGHAQEINPVDPAERGPALANQVVHSIDRPAQLVTGNGDVSLMWDGGSGNFGLTFGKSDFWGVVRGNITTAGHLRLTCREIQSGSGSFSARQNIGPATITGKFTAKDGAELTSTAWVAYPQNLIVTELNNTGNVPLHFTSGLMNGLRTPSLPVASGSTADSAWIQVTPDLVNFEVGSRSFQKTPKEPKQKSFVGTIAGLQITSPEDTEPFLAWHPADPTVQNIGSLPITPNGLHGDSVQFDGVADHRLVLPGGCIPQTAFTFTGWINPSQLTPDATVFSAIGHEYASRYPYFRGFLVHLVDGKPEVRLNYYTATASAPVPLNQWTEIKAVYENQLLTLYVNGQQVAQADNPPASAQMGWDKCVLRTGDPALPFKGCAPQAILRQRVLGTPPTVAGQTISFTVDPGKTARLLVSLVSDRNTPDYKKAAQDLTDLNEAGIQKLKDAHDKWWHDFWGKSFIEIPDKRVMENWYGSLYDLACCSRADCPPPGLYHNFITGMDVPWNGDYTLDYNYQAPFWAAYATNHFELADNYEPLLLDHIGRGEAIAQNAWRLPTGGQPDSLEKYLAQRTATPPSPNPNVYHGIYLYTHLIPLPGWSDDYGTFWNQKSNALFCAVNMVQRWRLTRDDAYAKKVYPFLKGTADFWDDYLVLQDGRYSSLHDAWCENGGDTTNPATTLSFIRLLYPSLIEISERLDVDADRRAKWHDILDKLSPFTYIDAASLSFLKNLSPDFLKDKKVIRNCEANSRDFPTSAYNVYHDHKERGSSAGMSCVQAIFPGWSFGLESPAPERDAALNTVTFAAQWFDANNDCNFYSDAAAAGYDPKEILTNLDALLENHEQPNFTMRTAGGGTEDDAIVTAALSNMFLQSYQTNLHVFPNWPKDQDASFGGLPACGGFLVGSRQTQGNTLYVQIRSEAGEICRLANPWPKAKVKITSNLGPEITGEGDILKFTTQKNEIKTLTPLP